MIVDVHIHFLSPHALDVARRDAARLGVRVLDDAERPRLVIGSEPPTRPLLEGLYTLDRHREFLASQNIDVAVFGPLMDVAGYSLPAAQGAAHRSDHLLAPPARARLLATGSGAPKPGSTRES